MVIEEVLKQLDGLFAQHQVEQVEPFLLQKMDEAEKEGDIGSMITLVNELIGHYRETGEFEKSISCCKQALILTEQAGLKGTVVYATTLLNVANACRAAGLLRESMIYYQEVKAVYEKELEHGDFRYASLYNNMSLLFQEMGDFESACDCLERALSIATMYAEARIEVAVTYTNLAASQLKLGRYQDAIDNLQRAFAIFEEDEDKDIYKKVTHRYGERIIHATDIEGAINAYDALSQNECKFILVNSIDSDNDSAIISRYVMKALDEGATVIFRNILKPTRVSALNSKVNENLDHGMTFSNGKISIVVGRKSLPRQSFSLWF